MSDPYAAMENPYRQLTDRWLALMVSIVQVPRDLADFASGWARVAPPGPGAERVAGWVTEEVERRRRGGEGGAAPARDEATGGAIGSGWWGASLVRPDPRAFVAGGRVQARSCPVCRAARLTPATSAYIYCDYCAALIDVDWDVAKRAGDTMDPGVVWKGLLQRYGGEMKEARLAGDRARYRALWREFMIYMVVGCPVAFSPRVWDARYRQAYIDGFDVPVTTAKNFNRTWRQRYEAHSELESAMVWREDDTIALDDALAHLRRYDALVRAEAKLAVHIGAMARHPDKIDAARWVSIKRRDWMRDSLSALRPDDAAELVRRAGMEADFFELPAPDTATRRCGRCGNPRLIAAGASRVLCDRCGFILDAEAPSLPCPRCKADIILPVGAPHGQCHHCNLTIIPS